jgi:hypothetical protein
VRGKGSKLCEPCPKVRLSQGRLPVEQFACMKSYARGNGTFGDFNFRDFYVANLIKIVWQNLRYWQRITLSFDSGDNAIKTFTAAIYKFS